MTAWTRAVMGGGVIAVIACVLGRAQADELSLRAAAPREPGLGSPVRVDLAACLDADRDAIQHAIQIELSDQGAIGATEVAVLIACVPDGVDAGVVLEVRRPDSARRYRYALDWRAQPADARPRLLGLAVAEAVAASRIELTAVPEPPVVVTVGPRSTEATRPARATSDWAVAVIGSRRLFAADAGVRLTGGGLMPSRRLSGRWRLAFDLLAEGGTVVVEAGAIRVLSVSAAPRLQYRVGGRLHGELGAGVRAGVVRMQGETSADSELVGEQLVRAWFGPAATAAVGFDLTPQIALDAGLELGAVASGATAREIGQPAAVLAGRWTSFGIFASFGL